MNSRHSGCDKKDGRGGEKGLIGRSKRQLGAAKKNISKRQWEIANKTGAKDKNAPFSKKDLKRSEGNGENSKCTEGDLTPDWGATANTDKATTSWHA